MLFDTAAREGEKAGAYSVEEERRFVLAAFAALRWCLIFSARGYTFFANASSA